jgi:hypothetical protein
VIVSPFSIQAVGTNSSKRSALIITPAPFLVFKILLSAISAFFEFGAGTVQGPGLSPVRTPAFSTRFTLSVAAVRAIRLSIHDIFLQFLICGTGFALRLYLLRSF